MFEKNPKELLQAWKDKISPPDDELEKFDYGIKYVFNGQEHGAMIWWDGDAHEYVFHPIIILSKDDASWHEVAYVDNYNEVTDIIRTEFGPVRIEGIYNWSTYGARLCRYGHA